MTVLHYFTGFEIPFLLTISILLHHVMGQFPIYSLPVIDVDILLPLTSSVSLEDGLKMSPSIASFPKIINNLFKSSQPDLDRWDQRFTQINASLSDFKTSNKAFPSKTFENETQIPLRNTNYDPYEAFQEYNYRIWKYETKSTHEALSKITYRKNSIALNVRKQVAKFIGPFAKPIHFSQRFTIVHTHNTSFVSRRTQPQKRYRTDKQFIKSQSIVELRWMQNPTSCQNRNLRIISFLRNFSNKPRKIHVQKLKNLKRSTKQCLLEEACYFTQEYKCTLKKSCKVLLNIKKGNSLLRKLPSSLSHKLLIKQADPMDLNENIEWLGDVEDVFDLVNNVEHIYEDVALPNMEEIQFNLNENDQYDLNFVDDDEMDEYYSDVEDEFPLMGQSPLPRMTPSPNPLFQEEYNSRQMLESGERVVLDFRIVPDFQTSGCEKDPEELQDQTVPNS